MRYAVLGAVQDLRESRDLSETSPDQLARLGSSGVDCSKLTPMLHCQSSRSCGMKGVTRGPFPCSNRGQGHPGAWWAGWAHRHLLPGVAAVQNLHVQARNSGAQRMICCVAGGALDLGAHSLPAQQLLHASVRLTSHEVPVVSNSIPSLPSDVSPMA